MIVGIDFDNTLVCYDKAFHQAACEQGLIPLDTPVTKGHVRDYLRGIGEENSWTELQGYVYGSRMDTVETFTGATDCIRHLTNRGATVYIISHKTRYPYRGNRYDLHEAARNWLSSSGFLDAVGLGMDRVLFELTKEEKLSRIGTMGCTHFIDDLPDILCADGFPVNTVRMLFSPDIQIETKGMLTFASWKEIADYFRGTDAA